jgi:enoyl-CoA hydratase/carnithine racemase
MTFKTLRTDVNDRLVGCITLNRPDQLNTFNSTLAQELFEGLIAMDQNPKVRVIVLKGAGKAFCAGIDINELEGKSALEYRDWVEHMERPLLAVSQLKKPVIAQVHGVAAANGVGLVAAADLAVAAENARMGLTAIKVGLNCVVPVIPVARSIGRKRALEMLFFGEMIKAPAAMEMGLINRVVPKQELETATLHWAERLAAMSPVAVRVAKQAFYGSQDMSYAQQFDYMNEAFARLCTSSDAKEGVAAFFEKRPPVWKGK